MNQVKKNLTSKKMKVMPLITFFPFIEGKTPYINGGGAKGVLYYTTKIANKLRTEKRCTLAKDLFGFPSKSPNPIDGSISL